MPAAAAAADLLQGRDRSVRELPATSRDLGRREPRRSEPVAASGYPNYSRSARSSAALGAENVAPAAKGSATSSEATARRSGRLGTGHSMRPGFRGSASLAASGSGVGPSPRNRITGALGDITNVVHAASRQGLGKLSKNSSSSQQQQQQQQTAAAPRSPLQPPAAGTAGAGAAQQANTSHQPAAQALRAAAHADEAAFNAPFQGDSQDTQKISDYAAEVHAQLFEDEVLLMPRADYMEGQADINSKMRAILIDWLVEVHMKYRLRPESLFLTVNLIDRYLSVRTVMRKKLQLLGVTCMLIATKFEEIDPPKISEFAYITDNTYTKSDILSMECTILVALDFQIAVPTPVHFISRLVRANSGDLVHRHLAQYLLELALLDLKLIRHPPSLLVSAAILLANELLGQHPAWPAAMVHHGRRPVGSLAACAEEMRALLDAAPKASLQAVRRKYQLDTNSAVANMSFGAIARPRE